MDFVVVLMNLPLSPTIHRVLVIQGKLKHLKLPALEVPPFAGKVCILRISGISASETLYTVHVTICHGLPLKLESRMYSGLVCPECTHRHVSMIL